MNAPRLGRFSLRGPTGRASLIARRSRDRKRRPTLENLEQRTLMTVTFTEFPIPSPFADSQSITTGPDGNLWFEEFNTDKIGRITPTGVITEFRTPTANSAPSSIAAGPDGNLWFTEANNNNPYQTEWDILIDAIRNNKPHNEVKRGVMASLTSSLGRMAAHTGMEVTLQEILNSDHEFAPGLDKLTKDGPAPLLPDANGRYPIPHPGIITKTEY